jgi:hypothetical protein
METSFLRYLYIIYMNFQTFRIKRYDLKGTKIYPKGNLFKIQQGTALVISTQRRVTCKWADIHNMLAKK